MANTFKTITKAGVTSADVIYTVASSTTTVLLGIMIGNTTTSQITVTVSLASDTSNSCLLYTSPSPRDLSTSRMPSSA